jgi:phosphatidylserine decarboxylase
MTQVVVLGAVLALVTGLPLAWKWELGLGRSAVALLVFAALAGVLIAGLLGLEGVGGVVLTWLLAMALAAAVVLWRFYRDPERTPPEGEDLIISPAEGQVIYVKRSAGGQLPSAEKQGRSYPLQELTRTPLNSGDAVVIGIALSFLDVHVNRAPVPGKVLVQRRFPGAFASLKDPSAVFLNERATTVLEHRGLQVAVVLIASRLVRRIVSYVKEGEEVELGQRIGVIRFGSQVDLVLPARLGLEVKVEPGERVRAGETIVATFTAEDRT